MRNGFHDCLSWHSHARAAATQPAAAQPLCRSRAEAERQPVQQPPRASTRGSAAAASAGRQPSASPCRRHPGRAAAERQPVQQPPRASTRGSAAAQPPSRGPPQPCPVPPGPPQPITSQQHCYNSRSSLPPRHSPVNLRWSRYFAITSFASNPESIFGN